MLDTPKYIEEKVIELMQARTPTERLLMLSDMFNAGRQLVLANISEDKPGLTPKETRGELFRRMYGNEFSEEEQIKICARLSDAPL